MKLYYSPGACSLSPHIVLREAELPFELVLASTKTKKLEDGSDFNAVNAKSYVPVLELDNGERLTEGPAIVQYLADQVPEKALAPVNGTFARYRLQEWLNFITSELHKSFSPLFKPDTPDAYKPVLKQRIAQRLAYVDAALASKPFLLGDTFSVADAYLFVIGRWAPNVGIDVAGLENFTAFMNRVKERPAVQAALKAEGGKK